MTRCGERCGYMIRKARLYERSCHDRSSNCSTGARVSHRTSTPEIVVG